VTGGAGFIGSHVADRLLGFGHEVLIVDNLASGSRANIPSSAQFSPLHEYRCPPAPALHLWISRPELQPPRRLCELGSAQAVRHAPSGAVGGRSGRRLPDAVGGAAEWSSRGVRQRGRSEPHLQFARPGCTSRQSCGDRHWRRRAHRGSNLRKPPGRVQPAGCALLSSRRVAPCLEVEPEGVDGRGSLRGSVRQDCSAGGLRGCLCHGRGLARATQHDGAEKDQRSQTPQPPWMARDRFMGLVARLIFLTSTRREQSSRAAMTRLE
jgi:hypothetical protein